MKTKIIIEEGKSKIILFAQNDFETDLIEKIKDGKMESELCAFKRDRNGFSAENINHRIEIDLKDISYE